MTRVLLFPFAPGRGLAHVGACLAVAGELAARGHEPTVAYGGSLPELVHGPGVRVEPVPEVPVERTSGDTVAHWFDSPDDLERMVRADLALIHRVRPEAVVVDVRLSATIAAELAGVPSLLLMHFLRLTSYYRELNPHARLLRELRRPQRIPLALRRMLTRDPHGGIALERIVRETRQRLGLREHSQIWSGSHVACTTTPLLDPAELPDTWSYVGPICWSAPGGVVPRETALPLVYVTQGTTGSADLLRRALGELSGLPVHVIASTGGAGNLEELRQVAPEAEIHPFVASGECLARADAAVLHGGHLSASQAHAEGVPVVVIPYGSDQWAWADRVEELGTGVALRPPLPPGAIRRALGRVFREARYRDAAGDVARDLRRWNGPAASADLVEGLLAP